MNVEKKSVITVEPVPQEMAGIRLDKWLAMTVPDLSRTRISALISENCVSLGEKTCSSASVKVKEGEVYQIVIPPPIPALPVAQDIPLDILFEDEHLIVVNKPAGMVVHPAAGNWDNTLVNALLAHTKNSLSVIGGVERAGIVHRIDKETSGILVVAKNDKTHNALAQDFKNHSIERIYYALVWGMPTQKQKTISGNIARSRANRQKMTIVRSGGKEAVTHYTMIKTFAQGAVSLLKCVLETGRTHQIRVHLTAHGLPLIGDKIYTQNRKTTGKLSERQKEALVSFKRQALHAGFLGFVHPITKQEMTFEAPMPTDMSDLIKILETK